MSDAPKLKPCPHCGAAAQYHVLPRGIVVVCTKRDEGCPVNARTHHCGTAEHAAVQWNTRREDHKLTELLADYRHAKRQGDALAQDINRRRIKPGDAAETVAEVILARILTDLADLAGLSGEAPDK